MDLLLTIELALARARARIVIEKAETRFNEYFERHPLAMMIYDVSTLRILAANDAAAIQYGYSRDALRKMQISSIRPTEDVSSFLNDLTTFQAHVAHSDLRAYAVMFARTGPHCSSKSPITSSSTPNVHLVLSSPQRH